MCFSAGPIEKIDADVMMSLSLFPPLPALSFPLRSLSLSLPFKIPSSKDGEGEGTVGFFRLTGIVGVKVFCGR